MYGITETTVHVTYRPLTLREVEEGPAASSDGRCPTFRSTCWGESRGWCRWERPGRCTWVAREWRAGISNRAGLTAERFVPHPYATRPGERLYRSGDLARYGADGELEYLGRIDQQVKVRGFRIELGEVEAALAGHPSVQEAVAVAREGEGGEKRIVGYVVLEGSSGVGVGELRAYLKERLPEYMVPSALVRLERMPLTATGKVDRRALPAPASERTESSEYVAPRNELESILAEVWEKALDVTPVGIHDDYFALGGDSMRVIQLVHELGRYNLTIAPRDVFLNPTVYGLAKHLRGAQPEQARAEIPLHLVRLPDEAQASLPEGVEDAYTASRMQRLMLYHYAKDESRGGVYHYQQWMHLQDETMSLPAFRKALEVVVQRHRNLRTVFTTAAGVGTLQLIKNRLGPRIEEEDISHLSAAEQESHIREAVEKDRARPFATDDMNEPLVRFKLLVRSEDSVEFLYSIHHAIDDGWGNVEFLNELRETYEAVKRGQEVDTTPGPDSYKEFIALEQEILSSREAAEFWGEHLRNERHQSPWKREVNGRPAETDYALALGGELSAELKRLAKRLRISLKTVFLSAYLELIAAQTGEEVATVGVISNGRSERLSDPLKTMGLFWNMIPFCGRVVPADRLSQLREVQRLLIDIEPHVRYPLTQMFEDRHKPELFFATLNFLYFHNNRQPGDDSGPLVLRSNARDKLHYPLNYVVSVNPFSGEVGLQVGYNEQYFSGEDVRSMAEEYVVLLRKMTQLGEELDPAE